MTSRRPALPLALLIGLIVSLPGTPGAQADDVWNPFSTEPETSRPPPRKKQAVTEPPQPYLPPMDAAGSAGRSPSPPGTYGTPYGAPSDAPQPYDATRSADAQRPRGPLAPSAPVPERDRAVDRGDLAPVMAPDGSGMPMELWQGIDLATFEQLVARLEIPPRSPALHALWRRLVTSESAPPSGAQGNAKFDALRAEVLFRSGLLKEMSAALAKVPNAAADPVLAPIVARAEIALGNREKGCAVAKGFGVAKPDVPKILRAEGLMMLGYCVAANGNPAGAGLAADVARDEGWATACRPLAQEPP